MDYDFYNIIKKPDYAPKQHVFSIVWRILYLIMGISFVILILSPISISKVLAIPVFFFQLLLNLIWVPVFFKFKKMGWALFLCIWLLGVVLYMTKLFFSISFILGLLQIPYVLWLFFATILNYQIIRLNR